MGRRAPWNGIEQNLPSGVRRSCNGRTSRAASTGRRQNTPRKSGTKKEPRRSSRLRTNLQEGVSEGGAERLEEKHEAATPEQPM